MCHDERFFPHYPSTDIAGALSSNEGSDKCWSETHRKTITSVGESDKKMAHRSWTGWRQTERERESQAQWTSSSTLASNQRSHSWKNNNMGKSVGPHVWMRISGTPRLDARHRRRRHLPCLFVWHAHEADIKSVKKVATTLHRHVFTALLRRCPLQQQQLQSTEHTEFRCFLCFQEISKVTTFNMYVYTYTYINKLSY